MYENNYNYITVQEEQPPASNSNNNNSGKKPGRFIAMLLAVALIGGISGYGGAYLQNSTSSSDTTNSIVSSSSDSTEAVATSTSSESTNSINSLITSAANTSGELTTSQIVEKVSPSVVSVQATFELSSGTAVSTGTGIILSEDGYIITNAHVIQTSDTQYTYSNSGSNGYNSYGGYSDFYNYFFGGNSGNTVTTETVTVNASTVTIVLSYDDEAEYTAEIIGADTNSDLAVLKIDTEAAGITLTAAEFGDSDELVMGSKAVAIGYPLGLGLSTSEGIISGLNRTLNVELSTGGSASMTLIQTDASVNPGNSGGPLVNAYGQVVGIVSSKLVDSDVEGLGFAIPITDAMPIISDLMNQGYVTTTTPQIGITATTVNAAVARYYGLPVTSGVMVVSVEEGSGADVAGLSEGDVIVAVDGKEVTSMDDLTSAKSGKSVGDVITVTLARNGGNVDVTITLTAASSETTTATEETDTNIEEEVQNSAEAE